MYGKCVHLAAIHMWSPSTDFTTFSSCLCFTTEQSSEYIDRKIDGNNNIADGGATEKFQEFRNILSSKNVKWQKVVGWEEKENQIVNIPLKAQQEYHIPSNSSALIMAR